MWSDLTLDPSFGPRGLQCETNLQEIMGWESFDVVRFDFGSFLRGQTIAKSESAYKSPFLGPIEVCNVKPSYRKSWAGNFLMCSDFTFGPSFKVK